MNVVMMLKMKKFLMGLLSIFMMIVSGLSLFACSFKNNFSDAITITDMEGTQVTISTDVDKVACISPSATDLMIAFGLGDKIVGTYRSFTYNPWTTEIYPNAANFKGYSYSVSAEELLADDIDLVILQNTENAETFRYAGLPVVAVHQYSPNGAFDEEVYEMAELIGNIFGGNAKIKADAWIREVKDTITEIKTTIGESNSENAVYYVNGEKQKGLCYSDGGNSMISRIFDIANVRLATEKYGVLNVHKVSDEEMVALNPYAMLIGGAYQNYLVNQLNNSAVWASLDCNKYDRIYRIPVAMVGIENVSAETPVMLKYVASLFNSSYVFDMKTELKANIKKYFNYDLTDGDVENMCNALTKNGEEMVKAE